jgi:hypothetical protein
MKFCNGWILLFLAFVAHLIAHNVCTHLKLTCSHFEIIADANEAPHNLESINGATVPSVSKPDHCIPQAEA